MRIAATEQGRGGWRSDARASRFHSGSKFATTIAIGFLNGPACCRCKEVSRGNEHFFWEKNGAKYYQNLSTAFAVSHFLLP